MAKTYYCTNVVLAPHAGDGPWCGQPVVMGDYGVEHRPGVSPVCDTATNDELVFSSLMSVSLLTHDQAKALLEGSETLRLAHRDGHDVYIAETPDGEERTLCYAKDPTN